jgi:hypothetical protein
MLRTSCSMVKALAVVGVDDVLESILMLVSLLCDWFRFEAA